MLRRLLPVLPLIALVAAMLLLGGPGSEVDRTLLYSAQREALVPAARLVTRLGDWWVVAAAAAAGAAWLAVRRQWRAALCLILLILSQRALVELMKQGFDRVRPDPAGHLDAVHSMAFPSGHSANAMALALGLALLAVPRAWRGMALALGLAYAAAVGLSRLVLGVHWPSDVIGGWAVGALWALLVVRLAGGRAR